MFVNNIKIMAIQKNKIIKYIKDKIGFIFSIIDMELISFEWGLKILWN